MEGGWRAIEGACAAARAQRARRGRASCHERTCETTADMKSSMHGFERKEKPVVRALKMRMALELEICRNMHDCLYLKSVTKAEVRKYSPYA